jgi:hypothetical protein
MFDLGAKVKINPFHWGLYGSQMSKDDPNLHENSIFTIKRRGKLRLTFEETNVRIPLTWMIPADGISLNQEGKRVCRRDVDEAAKRAHKTGKGIAMPYFYYSVGSSILREIGMEARSEAAFEDGTLRRGLGGAFRHKSHPLTVLVSSIFDWEEQNFWVGATLDRGRVEQFMRESSTKSLFSFFQNPPKSGGNYFPLEVFESSVTFDTPRSVLNTAEGWNQLIDHLRKVCS